MAQKWWKRAREALKDRRSICLTQAGLRRHHSAAARDPQMEAAVIRATSHDEAALDHKSMDFVYAWAARTSHPSPFAALMRSLARRVERTGNWAVALKCLVLLHGLLISPEADLAAVYSIGRLPFDLSGFRDRSARHGKSWAFSAFVRAYFRFLDQLSVFLNRWGPDKEQAPESDDLVARLQEMQDLLELLMQIRPYGDGVEVGLVAEAMDSVVVEVFDIYGGLCDGIARSLPVILASKKGALGIGILRRAAEQSSRLSAYFDLCRRLGVPSASDVPTLESVPEEDIEDLEKMVVYREEEEEEGEEEEKEGEKGEAVVSADGRLTTVVTREWVVF